MGERAVGRWWAQALRRWHLVMCRARADGEMGMTTAEYAVGTIAAAAFAAVLIAIVRSDAVRAALTSIITTALSTTG